MVFVREILIAELAKICCCRKAQMQCIETPDDLDKNICNISSDHAQHIPIFQFMTIVVFRNGI
jgi:hypothetical protein